MGDTDTLRRPLSGFAQLALATIAGQAIGFVALAYVTREIGPSLFGAYTFVAGLVLWFAVPANFGATLLGTRDFALAGGRRRQIVSEVVLIQVGLATVLYVALVLLRPVISPGDAQSALVPIVGLTMLATALNLEWALQGAQRYGAMALARLGGQVAYGVLIAILITDGLTGAKRYALANVLGFLVAALISGWALLRIAPPRGAQTPARRSLGDVARAARGRFGRALPLGFAAVMVQVYYSIDAVMLGYMDDDRAVGLYGAAYRIPMAVIAFALLWVVALYPHAARLFRSDPDRLRRQVGAVASYALVLAVAVSAGASLLSTELMPAVFGSDFADGARPFALLSASAAVVLVSVNFGNVLLACGDERRYAAGVTAGAVLNVALNLALIPSAGPAGAAVATLAAEALVLAFMVVRFREVVGPPPLLADVIGRGLVAAGAMAVAILASSALPAFAQLAVALVVFTAAASMLRFGRLVDLFRAARSNR